MKTCSKCKRELDMSCFHKDKKAKDGLRCICKDCQLQVVKEWKKANPDRCRENLKRWQKANPDYMKRWQKENPDRFKEIQRKWQLNHKLEINSHNKLHYAVKNGSVVRPDKCSYCDKKCVPDGHHRDYTQPLEVEWLCRECHKMLHAELNKNKNKNKIVS